MSAAMWPPTLPAGLPERSGGLLSRSPKQLIDAFGEIDRAVGLLQEVDAGRQPLALDQPLRIGRGQHDREVRAPLAGGPGEVEPVQVARHHDVREEDVDLGMGLDRGQSGLAVPQPGGDQRMAG